MDIICKCGHDIKEHSLDNGCWYVYGDNKKSYVCDCDLTCYNVAFIFATEQQARIDTCRAQIDVLKEVEKDFQWLLSMIENLDLIDLGPIRANKVREMLVKYVG